MYPIVCFFAGWFLQKTRHKISINKTSASDTPRACVSVCECVCFKSNNNICSWCGNQKNTLSIPSMYWLLFFNQYHTRLPLETYWYFFHRKIACFCYLFIFSNTHLTFSFSTKSTKAVLSISTGWPCLSYSARTKWKKLDFLRLEGGCFS